jgi:hypothetical protein
LVVYETTKPCRLIHWQRHGRPVPKCLGLANSLSPCRTMKPPNFGGCHRPLGSPLEVGLDRRRSISGRTCLVTPQPDLHVLKVQETPISWLLSLRFRQNSSYLLPTEIRVKILKLQLWTFCTTLIARGATSPGRLSFKRCSLGGSSRLSKSDKPSLLVRDEHFNAGIR